MHDTTAFKNELDHILAYWQTYALDKINGGFTGMVSNDNVADTGAPKGSVLNARIIWTFSQAYNQFKDTSYLSTAAVAYNYFISHFIDKEHGGVYWTLDSQGNALDTKKQVYAIAFSIYALAAYHEASNNEEALYAAIQLYRDLEMYSYDNIHGGYFEAFTMDWQALTDMRLSDKDANEKKTMNTHLHILEAYTGLYKVWPDERLGLKIKALIGYFTNHIIDAATFHLNLFMDEQWTLRSTAVSFGHDIEASWLLLEAAEILQDHSLIENIKNLSVKMAYAAAEGIAADGSLYYEYEPLSKHWVKEKHWWVQAEAMVGFLNAYQLSGDDVFLQYFNGVWAYTQQYIIDQDNGEWFWGRFENNELMQGEDKVGIWKCPYHNGRALMETIKRLEQNKIEL